MPETPTTVSGVLKDLDRYALESGIPRSTLWDWIQLHGFPAIALGHRLVVSPVHALAWFESRQPSGNIVATEGHGEEKGTQPGQLRRDPDAEVGTDKVGGARLRPPATRSERAA